MYHINEIDANKIFVPFDATSALGSLGAIKEVMKEDKVIITVSGQDKVGIVASVAQKLAVNNVNIEDIKQTIMQDNFVMIMLCDIKNLSVSFKEFKDDIQKLEAELSMEIWVQKKEIFDRMHTI